MSQKEIYPIIYRFLVKNGYKSTIKAFLKDTQLRKDSLNNESIDLIEIFDNYQVNWPILKYISKFIVL